MPCKLGVTGSIPSISSLSNGTIIEIPASYDISCWWDVKPQINQPIITFKHYICKMEELTLSPIYSNVLKCLKW